MGNYYALLKVKLNGDVDLDTTLSIGELLVKDIQDIFQNIRDDEKSTPWAR